jgi:hypothetical protein
VKRSRLVVVFALLLLLVSGCGESKAKERAKTRVSTNSSWLIVATGKPSQRRLASYRYYHLGSAPVTSYEDAVGTFGKPSSRSTDDVKRSNLCTVRWSRLGLEMGFANAPPGTCRLSRLRTSAWYGATVYSRRWQTERGLRVGDSVARLRDLYPNARFSENAPPKPPSWGLVWEGEDEIAGYSLSANVWDGRVVAIVVAPGYIF